MSQASPIKQITTEQLRVGMYVHKLCCSWLTTPFWQSSFPVDEQQTIARIAASGVTRLWIDTGKGGDVATQATQAAPPLAVATLSAAPPEAAPPRRWQCLQALPPSW